MQHFVLPRAFVVVAAAVLLSTHALAAPPKASSVQPSKTPGATFQECAECPTMVVIPTGTYTMGSPETDPANAKGEESPQHQVTIGKVFALAATHVTRGDFARFAKETGYKVIPGCNIFPATGPKVYANDPAASWDKPGLDQTDDHPVVCASWDDAQAYIAWLNKKVSGNASGPYRLPNESEWEFAARGGTTSKYFWGEDRAKACEYASAADLSGQRANPKWVVPDCDDGYAATSPVATFKPNPYGLYDIVGNAWQWQQDCWHPNYNGAPTDGSPWMDAGGCHKNEHASRGGSWRYDPIRGLRAASRGLDPADSHWASVGFRLARTID